MAGIETMEFESPASFWGNCADGWCELFIAARDQGDVGQTDFWFELALDAEYMRMVLSGEVSADPLMASRLLR